MADEPVVAPVVETPPVVAPVVAEPANPAEAAKVEAERREEKALMLEPIDYAKAIKLPDGVKADDPMFAEAAAIFGEGKLAPEAAQKLMDLAFRRDAAAVKANADAWQTTIKGWQTALKADPDFGGANLIETTSLAAKAIDAYGGKDAPEIREFMKTYGLGDHPAFARLLARAGRSVREDNVPRPGQANGAVTDARSHFPNSNMNP